MAKSPKCFNRLYVNMIKAGEAGGALELILQRLADFQERAESLKRKVKGAMIYPIVVITVAVGILTFIMIKIVPAFEKIFEDFDLELPTMTLMLVGISQLVRQLLVPDPRHPVRIWLTIKLIRKFKHGRIGWDQFVIKVPDLRPADRKEHPRPHHADPRHAGLQRRADPRGPEHHPRHHRQRRVRENVPKGQRSDPRGRGDRQADEGKLHPRLPSGGRLLLVLLLGGPIGLLIYLLKFKQRIVDDIVVNMVDVGEETGELDTMLYKVADTYDEEVAVLTESLTKLMEPLLILFLGGMVGFIVIALFIPLVKLIEGLSK